MIRDNTFFSIKKKCCGCSLKLPLFRKFPESLSGVSIFEPRHEKTNDLNIGKCLQGLMKFHQ